MKLHTLQFFTLAIACLIVENVHAQGCVAIRNMSSCQLSFDSARQTQWQFFLNYRYFKSFRHFTGKEEDKERIEENTNVINHDNSVIFGGSYKINKRWAITASIPVVYIDRSSRPRALDDRTQRAAERHYTTSKGLGDIRIVSYYSIIPFQTKRQLTVGVGLKLPTGNYKYTDDAYQHNVSQPSFYDERPVDQSIQPGDGGLGVLVEADFAKEVFTRGYFYVNGSYLFNPRNTNGTKTNRSNPYEQIMSVADQGFIRSGIRYFLNNLQLGLGGRLEGIPVRDLIGKSDGFRRPGYIISVEPSVSYEFGEHAIGMNVPIAAFRNRTQSLADKRLEAEQPSNPQHGDAAFADWLLSFTYSYRF